MVDFKKPEYSRSQVDKAGRILCLSSTVGPSAVKNDDYLHSIQVMRNWRASHAYPLNTFQTTLRTRLKQYNSPTVAQRLKRYPSIRAKLLRDKMDSMRLTQMQDIGGLRAVVDSVSELDQLKRQYEDSKLKHTLVGTYDYVGNPKPDGYRGIHLVYRYKSKHKPEYNDLLIELQLRTRLQHAWATAVETTAALGQDLKFGVGEPEWKEFFLLTSAAFADMENRPRPDGTGISDNDDVLERLQEVELQLNALNKLDVLVVLSDSQQLELFGPYQIIVLDRVRRTAFLEAFSDLTVATQRYGELEQDVAGGRPIDVVLVSTQDLDALHRAYPNYFLDTLAFREELRVLLED